MAKKILRFGDYGGEHGLKPGMHTYFRPTAAATIPCSACQQTGQDADGVSKCPTCGGTKRVALHGIINVLAGKEVPYEFVAFADAYRRRGQAVLLEDGKEVPWVEPTEEAELLEEAPPAPAGKPIGKS